MKKADIHLEINVIIKRETLSKLGHRVRRKKEKKEEKIIKKEEYIYSFRITIAKMIISG